MKMTDILNLASFYLGIDEGDGAARARLLKCANLAVNEICADYYPLVRETEVDNLNGKVPYRELSRHRVLEVLSVKKGCSKVPFSAFPTCVKFGPGRATVRYTCLPGDLDEGGSAAIPERIGARVVAYGAAAEYCLLAGLFEEAAIWDRRYRDSLRAAQAKKGEIRIPARRWA